MTGPTCKLVPAAGDPIELTGCYEEAAVIVGARSASIGGRPLTELTPGVFAFGPVSAPPPLCSA